MVELVDGFEFTGLGKQLEDVYAHEEDDDDEDDFFDFLSQREKATQGQVLTPGGTFSIVEYYAENSANTLPPLHFQASAANADLQRWKAARWNEDCSVYERTLQAHFISILACETADYDFVQCLKNLLVSQDRGLPVDTCNAYSIGFQKVWEPRYHTLDKSLAFFKLPQTITRVLEYAY
ncbi:hypothetical protein CYMTET_17420 [Cymbomonas tetramitiformis]|uniref:Uncharacterized protein n=1 Tax=Cymbomonas tetramitiformis TaxID=36881 RepID=A0AAE0GAF4_9CHLO|nr:hypothetical protein CYMTET_17420 [Cymbomonas tetramitiformis]